MLKNILYIYHNADAYGGGDESLLALLSKLNRNRFNPYVLCTSGGLFADKLNRLGIKFRIINKEYLKRIGRFRLLLLLIQLCLFVKRQNIKLIHINSLGRLHYLTLLCKFMGIHSVYHLRSLIVTKAICRRTRIIINLSDKIIAHCEHMKRTAIEVGLDKNKICVIYNGVDLDEFNPNISGDKFRKELNVNCNTDLVGTVGRIVPWKGYDDFIKAAAMVSQKTCNIKFVIVGEAPERDYLNKLIKLSEELSVRDKVIFTGLRSDMPEVFAALDLFVLPSWEEPFSRVTLEALAMARPVIGTNSGGTPEQLIDNVTGLLIPPKDPFSLAEAIMKLLQDRNKANEMSIRGRRKVEEKFGLNLHARRVEEVYKMLMKTK